MERDGVVGLVEIVLITIIMSLKKNVPLETNERLFFYTMPPSPIMVCEPVEPRCTTV
jgi:hypothetical protein